MIGRFLKTRAMRKFRRNRQAMVALTVIVVYLLVGIWVLIGDIAMAAERSIWGAGSNVVSPNSMLGFLSLESAEQVVAPPHVAPVGITQTPEKRLANAQYTVNAFQRMLRGAERAVLRRTAADPSITPADLEKTVILPALHEVRFAEREIKDAPLAEIRASLARIETLSGELEMSEDLDSDPALWPKLNELEEQVDQLFAPMGVLESARYWVRMSVGTDRQGRSVMIRGLYSIKVAFQVGLVVATISVIVGSIVGAAAAFFGSWVDQVVVWLYSTLSSVPDLVLLAVLVFMFTGSVFDDISKPYLSLVPLYAAMALTFWIGPCRVVRGETMKIKQLEYVQAATAIGFGRFRILLKHVLPNTVHLMFINFSLLFIAAIKNEVVLSFLGLGVKVGPSWGRMISESSSEVIVQVFQQIGAATVLMFGLVLAFNIVSDALQDAFDPKHVD